MVPYFLACAVKDGEGDPSAVLMLIVSFATLLLDDVVDDDEILLTNRLPPIHGRDSRNVNNIFASSDVSLCCCC